MSVKRLNYHSISVGQRRAMASQARLQIKMAMNSNPSMTKSDRSKYTERLNALSKWEVGTLEVSEQASSGTSHEVLVNEEVSVSEETG